MVSMFHHLGGVGDKEVLKFIAMNPGVSRFGIAKTLKISLGKTETILSDLEIGGLIYFKEINPNRNTKRIRIWFDSNNKNPMEEIQTEHKRIQRKRTLGWRLPDNAIIVSRPTRWGNPFTLRDHTLEESLELYRGYIRGMIAADPLFLEALRGYDLACWCPLSQNCHGDILLEFLYRIPT